MNERRRRRRQVNTQFGPSLVLAGNMLAWLNAWLLLPLMFCLNAIFALAAV